LLEAATTHRVGRKKEWPEEIRLSLAGGTLDRIAGVLEPGEFRLDMIRDAIDREILRRLTARAKQRNAEAKFRASPPTLPSRAKSKDAE
jgi:hypothetical protein